MSVSELCIHCILQADIYKEDFKNERKDRERAHTKSTELEERSKAEVSSLKEQLQRVSADNGRLTKVMREREGQMKTEIATLKKRNEEKSQQRDALKAEMVVLDVCTLNLAILF